MTLKEHIDNIGAALSANNANKNTVLFEQLHLLCLGWDELLYADNPTEGIRDSKHVEPYIYFKGYEDKIFPNYNPEAEKALDAFLDDWGSRMVTPREEYREVATGLLNAAARKGEHGFDHFQPAELSELVFRLSGYQKGMTVYNPYAGVGSYAGVLDAGSNYFGEEFDPAIWAIGVLRCHMNGCLSSNYVCGDSLNPEWKQPFDIVVSTPPIGAISLYNKESFTARLVNNAPTLLKPEGTMVFITNGSFLFSARGQSIAQSSLLDMVVTLPSKVFYWTTYPPVIVRLKAGRDASEPVKLIDGTSFGSPAGRMSVIIKVQELLKAIENVDSGFTALVSTKEIAENNYRLNPALYIKKEEDGSEGKKMVPLQELGLVIKPNRIKERTSKVIRLGNLSGDPLSLNITPDEREEDDTSSYGVLQESALLIGGNPSYPKFGYLSSNASESIGISTFLHAFIPNEELVSAQYVAVVLTDKGIDNTGSSIVRITLDDLALTRIPLISKREQEQVIKAFRLRHSKQHSSETLQQKVRVAMVGHPSEPAEFSDHLDIRGSFDKIKDAINWVKVSDNGSKIDAFIVNQTDDISHLNIHSLCAKDVPVFIISPDVQALEIAFESDSDDYLSGKCFARGAESDLYRALFRFCDDRNSPAGKIREVYARQLEAAADLDGKFQYDSFNLRDKLEEMLLDKDAGNDYVNDLRSIRDHCLLDPLIQYGYLPKCNVRGFTYGAEVDLLADRFHKEGYLLLKTLVPKNLANLLRAATPFLNEGSHVITLSDWDTQFVVLQIIMAFICLLSKLKGEGLFDGLGSNETKKEYVGSINSFQFQTGGPYPVFSLKDNPGYLYAEHVHLDDKFCKEKGIHAGNSVFIHSCKEEGYPKITDYEKIVFYSKDFDKA